jgi:hypothetical protein
MPLSSCVWLNHIVVSVEILSFICANVVIDIIVAAISAANLIAFIPLIILTIRPFDVAKV